MSAIDQMQHEETVSREKKLTAERDKLREQLRDSQFERTIAWVGVALLTFALLGVDYLRMEEVRARVGLCRLGVEQARGWDTAAMCKRALDECAVDLGDAINLLRETRETP